jgi:D-glycero-alpha-D-manno-heptose-7-phosphate kinase
MPAWFAKEDGAVLSATIDKYIYITARYMPEFYPNSYKVVWKHIEQVGSISEILHPTVRAALQLMGFEGERGVEITYHGDLPSNTGMGTSSAFAVGLLNALSVIRGDERWTESELAGSAIYMEQETMREAVGCQDQIAAAHGGVNMIRFPVGEDIEIERLDGPSVSVLQGRLMLFYTGRTRLGAELQKRMIAGMGDHAEGLRKLRALARRGGEYLSSRAGANTHYFGELMHKAWRIKRDLADGITNPIIDGIYDRAMGAGALGGKLCGAGGAGFMVFYVPVEKQAVVKDALRDLIHVPFKFEPHGSQIILNGDAK